MKSVPSQSPAVAGRRLRLALRNAREARDLTQTDVAEELYWSLSKVNRMESGGVSTSGTDLRALLDLAAIIYPERVGYLIALGRAARRRGWLDGARHWEYLTPALMQLVQFETKAMAIRSFQPTVLPGVMFNAGAAAARQCRPLPFITLGVLMSLIYATRGTSCSTRSPALRTRPSTRGIGSCGTVDVSSIYGKPSRMHWPGSSRPVPYKFASACHESLRTAPDRRN
jgi:transcriptional regulator with XRE-family HTH domain